MARVRIGDVETRQDVRMLVPLPDRDSEGKRKVQDPVSILCVEEDNAEGSRWNLRITIALSHEEALQLTAGLAVRLALRPDSTAGGEA